MIKRILKKKIKKKIQNKIKYVEHKNNASI